MIDNILTYALVYIPDVCALSLVVTRENMPGLTPITVANRQIWSGTILIALNKCTPTPKMKSGRLQVYVVARDKL